VRVVFAGTPAVAVPSLQLLLDSPRHEVVAVVTRPDRPAGRGRQVADNPVKALAVAAGVPVLAPDRPGDPTFLEQLTGLAPDCCPVVAYGALVPTVALDIPRHGWVNLHFSLLPAWRGAAPVQHAVLAGDEVTGACTFLLEEGLDTGPVFGMLTTEIGPRDTAGDLLARLADAGAGLLLATLDGLEDGSLQARPQPTDGVSLAPKLTVDDARVDWSAPALHVDRLVRACTPSPGAWTTLRGKRVKLGPVTIPAPGADRDADPGLAPGALAVTRTTVLVGTGSVAVQLGEVRPEGRGVMPAADWMRGLHPEPHERLE
jgi:methionyl-tRNA formyltransferase